MQYQCEVLLKSGSNSVQCTNLCENIEEKHLRKRGICCDQCALLPRRKYIDPAERTFEYRMQMIQDQETHKQRHEDHIQHQNEVQEKYTEQFSDNEEAIRELIHGVVSRCFEQLHIPSVITEDDISNIYSKLPGMLANSSKSGDLINCVEFYQQFEEDLYEICSDPYYIDIELFQINDRLKQEIMMQSLV